ncbi:MAG TPA: nucleotide disphospho-sugar-binding domain-containing protein [Rubrobacteraceae bacterium]|nr:nucleotide disphospho-sugar-binding domain-containing protein [Rubrobacteraceae bacterium]
MSAADAPGGMATVVHHVGAGTTAEGLRAGKPSAIFPSNFGDQLFWGRRVDALGVGPEPVPQKGLTAEGLGAAIRAVTKDEGMRPSAAELGEKIRTEDGVA